MRAPDGTICTQFDLHAAEDVSLIKYDALSVEAMDKIHICLDLLCNYGYIKKYDTLKETYEKAIGVYNLDRDSEEMWKMVWDHKILSLFQMEQQSGIQGIALAKPKSVKELSVLNSVIRLMAPDKNSETPLVTWSKYRNNINLWFDEMKRFGLTSEEIDWLAHHDSITDGICESQEGLMSLVQEERLGGNSLTFADKCRKGIAKKQGNLFKECEEIFYKNIKKNNCSERLAHYVWDVLLKVQRGYSFNRSHCLAYSIIGLQEMNLAYKYPIIFWNCANLISDSGVLSGENSDYAKIATAIGNIISSGIKLSLININNSNYNFEPDVDNNQILFGLGALSGINNQIIEKIVEHRPYKSFKDFLSKCDFNKTTMISLIKSGAFDELEEEWANELKIAPRILVMIYYILKISEPKSKLNLQNFNGLMKKNLIPNSLDFEKKVFDFNKILKTKKHNKFYILKEEESKFYYDNFDLDKIIVINENPMILQKDWDKIYQEKMDNARKWLKQEQSTILKEFNNLLFLEMWNKYAKGSISSWEMDSLCFYYNDHELLNIDVKKYGISNYKYLPDDPVVDYFFRKKEKQIPIYKIYRIIGTVIGKNDAKASISLLTTSGVVTVKFTKEYYANYAKQISELQEDGSKKVIEKSWFTRGNKLMIYGFRREGQFVAKTYKNTNAHQLYKITNISNNGKDLELVHERYGGSN